MRTITWRELVADATAELGAAVDARRIAEAASGHDGASLIAHLDDVVTRLPGEAFRAMVDRRAAGEPLQYVVGRWGFRRLDLLVDRRVLIPRPETEVVAGVAIDAARARADARDDDRGPVVVDLGTGSGAIAIAVADEVATAEVWATDASQDALAVARANLAGAGVRVGPRVRIVEGDWFGALPADVRGRIDVIVSNPPYVAGGDELPAEVRAWEPAAALYAGPRGTECLEHILRAARPWLAPAGVVVLELAPHQATAMVAFARGVGYCNVDVRADLAGRARVLVASC